MPRWKVNDELSFRYGSTWQVRESLVPNALALRFPDMDARIGRVPEAWWVRWATGMDAREIWSSLSTVPDPGYPPLERLASPELHDDFNWVAEPDESVLTVSMGERRILRGSQRGKSIDGVAVFCQAWCHLYGVKRANGLEIVGIALVGIAELELLARRIRGGLYRTHEGFRFEPYEALRRAQQRRGASRSESPGPRAEPRTPPLQPRTLPRQPEPSRPPIYERPVPQRRQCLACAGAGVVTCSACNGMGGHAETRVDYDWENNPVYREEWVICYACTGGMAPCTRCSGAGTVEQ